MHPLPLDPHERNALHDRALEEARNLRRAARDDFWRGADALLSGSLDAALRSARRLAHRLQRRQTQRGLG